MAKVFIGSEVIGHVGFFNLHLYKAGDRIRFALAPTELAADQWRRFEDSQEQTFSTIDLPVRNSLDGLDATGFPMETLRCIGGFTERSNIEVAGIGRELAASARQRRIERAAA